MKPTNAQINAFLQSPDSRVRVVLLYGPDAGLVSERAAELAHKIVPNLNDPFRVVNFVGNVVNDDPARLYDEAASQALGGGRRLIRIAHVSDGLAGSLGVFLESPPQSDALIVIEAGDLEKRSKLRALCESSNPRVIAIPCYLEDVAQRLRTISAHLESEGLAASCEVLGYLADSLPPDRLALRSELDKLALYARGKSVVTLSDVNNVVLDASAAETDDLVHAVANGDVKRVSLLVSHLFNEQTSPVAIFRAMQRHFLRLHLARSYVDGGLNPKAAIEKLQPKVFWKDMEPMARQIQRWSTVALEKFLQTLFESEAAAKQTSVPAETLCAHLLLQASSYGSVKKANH